jgi:hypothetical protein
MGDMSVEYAGHGRTGTFSVSRKFVQILANPCNGAVHYLAEI